MSNRRNVFYLLSAISSGAITATFVMAGSSSPVRPVALPAQLKPAVGFLRYVSRPLPNGTRYTFLYPAYMQKNPLKWPDTKSQFAHVQVDSYKRPFLPWIAVEGQKPILYYMHGKNGPSWPTPRQEFCSVTVGEAGYIHIPFGRTSLRQDRRWIGKYGSHHDFYITDKRTHLRFEVVHEDRYMATEFKQTDAVFANSFQILPPKHSATLRHGQQEARRD
jgi:hypothetical protein